MAESADQVGAPSASRDSAGRLADVRQRARQLLKGQSEKVRQVESKLSQQLAALLEEVNSERSSAEQRERQLREQIAELQRGDGSGESRREAESLLQEARVALSAALRERNDLKARLAECQSQLRTRAEEAEKLREAAGGAAAQEVAALHAERDELASKLADAEQRLEAVQAEGAQSAEVDDLRHRLEIALQENRQLKAEIAELGRKGTGPAADAERSPLAGFDWETQKQRLLDQLESDFDSDSQAKDKLTVEGAIRITDQAVAEKEQEISELKRLLEEQSGSFGDVAVGAAGVAQMLDSDELIREERENLKRLQEEWREKMRQAEVEVSVERAKLARERVELEERLRELEELHANSAGCDEAGEQQRDKTKKVSGGNWLARLGLKDE